MNKNIGAILLVAGCSIGVGMLGVPVMTGVSGFIPTILTFIFVWIFMTSTGFVLTEVALSFGKKDLNFIGIAEEIFGKPGKWVTFALYSVLFYSVMIAYSITGGALLADFFSRFTPYSISSSAMTVVIGVPLFGVIAKGIRSCDVVNRYLMGGLFISYLLMLFFGITHIESSRLLRTEWNSLFQSIPILVIAFGYHNLIPSLIKYLDYDEKAVKRSIVIGTLIPLAIYLIWNGVMLGMIPFETKQAWMDAQSHGKSIFQIIGTVYQGNPIAEIAASFTFFAVATSFLPVALSFLDFLQDGFKIKPRPNNRYFLAAFVLLPPIVIALFCPNIFLSALNFGGGFCTVILFGLLPALMAFKRGRDNNFKIAKKEVLVLLIIATFVIMGLEVLRELMVI